VPQTSPRCLIAAAYSSEELARADYERVLEYATANGLAHVHAVVLVREESGKVRAEQHSFDTGEVAGMGAVIGIVAGAVLAMAFPPLGLAIAGAALAGGLGGGLVGGAVGAAVGHLEEQVPRKELDALADVIGSGEAATIVIGSAADAPSLAAALTESTAQYVVEVSGGSIDDAVAAVRANLAKNPEPGDLPND
jgi:hypothetical protein